MINILKIFSNRNISIESHNYLPFLDILNFFNLFIPFGRTKLHISSLFVDHRSSSSHSSDCATTKSNISPNLSSLLAANTCWKKNIIFNQFSQREPVNHFIHFLKNSDSWRTGPSGNYTKKSTRPRIKKRRKIMS